MTECVRMDVRQIGNPSFAVKLLARIKHYFFHDRITFVFAVNINELQYTIKKHYGTDFDACRYLGRFFDLDFRCRLLTWILISGMLDLLMVIMFMMVFARV